VITENSFAAIKETIYFIGDCNEKCKTVLSAPNFVFLEAFPFRNLHSKCNSQNLAE